ncbi:HpcH/HpaI aldolase/citrate lyase family protein [Candidatus Bipolaricaulota bacterium]|nr:HpcH/HpaI aldolase/citrate lyase family protein [Candidatus Bipolaricaulota bacterium]
MPKETIVGSENKGDCRVRLTPADSLAIEIHTSNPDLFAPGIEAVVTETLAGLGVTQAKVEITEQGSLDYVIAARVEAAARTLFPDLPPLRPQVARSPSDRDRLRRTRLYAPGNNPRLLVGIELHGADCVLLDLEDSVPPAEKHAARVLVKHLLATVDFLEVWVRINPLATYGTDDLGEVMLARPHGICLPKAESAEDVKGLADELSRLETELGFEEGSTMIMPIIETGKGVLHAEEIATADPRVAVIAFGAEDYTRDVGAKRTQESLLFPRSQIVAAAATAGIQASDTVYANLEDEEGLIAETRHIRDLGFTGKGVINPRQIGPIHSVFSPSPEEIAAAERIVAAAAEAEKQGIGAIAIGGKMIDKPVLERARRTLRLAGKIKEGVE